MSRTANLDSDANTILQRLLDAWKRHPEIPFHYRPVVGYAFGWLLHSGFNDGARMSSHRALSDLEARGFIRFRDPGFPDQAATFVLSGHATSSLNALNRDQVSYNDSATREPEESAH